MRTTLENNDIYDPILRRGRKYGFADIIPATAFQIDANMPPLLFMTPAGAVNVRLPLAVAAMKGLRFTIVNLSAFVITLQTSTGVAFTNAMVCGVGQMSEVICTGSATAALQWVGGSSAATQTSP